MLSRKCVCSPQITRCRPAWLNCTASTRSRNGVGARNTLGSGPAYTRLTGSLMSGTPDGVPVVGLVKLVLISSGFVPGAYTITWCTPEMMKFTVPPTLIVTWWGITRCVLLGVGDAFG